MGQASRLSRSKTQDRPSSGAGVLPVAPKWLWNQATAAQNAPTGTVYFRKEIWLAEQPTEAYVVASCDNSFTLYINGQKAASGNDWNKLEAIDVLKLLVKGKNILAVKAVNSPVESKDKGEKSKTAEPQANPAGFLLQARVRHRPQPEVRAGLSTNAPAKPYRPGSRPDGKEAVMDFATDSSWLCTTNHFEHWEKPDFKVEDWSPAIELGEASMEPWKLAKKVNATLASASQYGHIRAALVPADPLMVALGRPNREQVITTRSTVATTLQMLELSNGQTLSKLLREGAEQLLAQKPASNRELINRLYETALGRAPTRQELQLAEELVGQPVRKEGVEDFLWAMAMLPEFQLIY